MATNPIPSIAIQASASPSDTRKSDQSRRSSSSANWWTPIFGWSSDSDSTGRRSTDPSPTVAAKLAARPDRIAPVMLTEEKARRLRMLTQETFHDKMYHSAIASRLASDFGEQSDM